MKGLFFCREFPRKDQPSLTQEFIPGFIFRAPLHVGQKFRSTFRYGSLSLQENLNPHRMWACDSKLKGGFGSRRHC